MTEHFMSSDTSITKLSTVICLHFIFLIMMAMFHDQAKQSLFDPACLKKDCVLSNVIQFKGILSRKWSFLREKVQHVKMTS